jgi:glycosyltransferase involved in cell wall biosynthesis
MRIGLNLLHALPEIGGGWNYIKGLMFALGEYGQENEYICYCTAESECLVPRKPNFLKRRAIFSGKDRIKRILYENTFLAIQAKKDRLECMHWFANTLGFFCPVPSVVTIYDMIPYEVSKSFSMIHQFYLRSMYPRTVSSANVLAPISQSTASAVARILKGDRARMVVVPPVISGKFRPASTEQIDIFRAKYGLPDEFWLYVAHFHGRKNHARLFKAYALMKACGRNYWPLVLRGEKIGADDLIARLLDENGITEDIIWLPRLSDEEMPLLFSSASALIYPSTYEGGGMPVMEAMACGCPVAASRIPTNFEFAGDAALLFDPMRVETITEAMQRFGSDSELRAKYRKIGLAKIEKLRPCNIGELIMSAYRKACRK